MAIQKGPAFLEGVTIGGIIYYKWKGLYLMRKAPGKGKVKQTTNTKHSATSFGLASTAAKLLYVSFKDVIPEYLFHLPMYGRVRAVMRKVIGNENSLKNADRWNYSHLENFYFNDHAIFPPAIRDENICKSYSGKSVFLSFPALNLKKIGAPKNTHFLSFHLLANVFDFSINKLIGSESVETIYDRNEENAEAKDMELHFGKTIKTGDVIIVALQIGFLNIKRKKISSIKHREHEASGIIGIMAV